METDDFNVTQQPKQGLQGYPSTQQPIYVKVEHRSNGLGTTGFVLALINAIVFWIPVIHFLCFVLWPLAGLLSFIGLFKSPRALAFVGFLLCFLPLIFLLIAGVGVGAFFAIA